MHRHSSNLLLSWQDVFRILDQESVPRGRGQAVSDLASSYHPAATRLSGMRTIEYKLALPDQR